MLHVFARALSFILPGAQGWAVMLAWEILSAVAHVVTKLKGAGDLSGKEKMALAVEITREFCDEAFDLLPGWTNLTEEARDRILAGVAELALVIVNGQADQDGTDRDLVRKVRTARSKLEARPLKKGAKVPKAEKVEAPKEPKKKKGIFR